MTKKVESTFDLAVKIIRTLESVGLWSESTGADVVLQETLSVKPAKDRRFRDPVRGIMLICSDERITKGRIKFLVDIDLILEDPDTYSQEEIRSFLMNGAYLQEQLLANGYQYEDPDEGGVGLVFEVSLEIFSNWQHNLRAIAHRIVM